MTFKETIYHQHDVVCNQKYADIHPYSFHLDCVWAQGNQFYHLIPDSIISNPNNFRAIDVPLIHIIEYSLQSHDVIEDGRLTYNNLKEIASEYLANSVAGEMVAEIVYCVTDEKGRNRRERKNEKYYEELKENKLAVFVKLADLAANTLYSKLTGSDMYKQYKKEWPKFKEQIYAEEYKEFFDYVESI